MTYSDSLPICSTVAAVLALAARASNVVLAREPCPTVRPALEQRLALAEGAVLNRLKFPAERPEQAELRLADSSGFLWSLVEHPELEKLAGRPSDLSRAQFAGARLSEYSTSIDGTACPPVTPQDEWRFPFAFPASLNFSQAMCAATCLQAMELEPPVGPKSLRPRSQLQPLR